MIMNTNNEPLLTPKEVMNTCRISRTTLWRWENVYGLKSVNVGFTKRIRSSDLAAFLQQHESKVSDPKN